MKKILFLGFVLLVLAGCKKGGSNGAVENPADGNATAGEITVTCDSEGGNDAVSMPVFIRNINAGETGWFASPIIEDLDGNGDKELVLALHSVLVYGSDFNLLGRASGNGKRIYAPHVVTDLEGDGAMEIIFGQGHEIYVYEWREGLKLKRGWPVYTTCSGNAPEVRGLAAADLDHDGFIEVVATTTQTLPAEGGGSQVYVFSYNGKSYRPKTVNYTAWPRYNNRSGLGGDADRNGMGHSGFGCYGLNVGIGNIDNDRDLEIIATYDNHHIQAFKTSGTAIDASPYFRNRRSGYKDMPLTWGQFIRWADPAVEERHYHRHEGEWPNPGRGDEWLQFTASPPSVYDMDGDGENEVITIPNIEKNEPYETQAYGVLVLEGAVSEERSARRKSGWEEIKRGGAPMDVVGWYPPTGIPAPAFGKLSGDDGVRMVVSLNDGKMHGFNKSGEVLWEQSYLHGKNLLFASEPVIADLNKDGFPEVIFTTFGDPEDLSAGYLMILEGTNGTPLFDIPLPGVRRNGNGNGAPSAPAIGDLDGDGILEIIVQTFDHGVDIFSVPESGEGCLLWTTSRGGPLRMGKPNGN